MSTSDEADDPNPGDGTGGGGGAPDGVGGTAGAGSEGLGQSDGDFDDTGAVPFKLAASDAAADENFFHDDEKHLALHMIPTRVLVMGVYYELEYV